MPAKRATYHHGNARSALIEAATALLESSGAAGLSLRQLAEHAGLSRQAPYNHFPDKTALLAELVRDGYERLARCVRATDRPDLGTPNLDVHDLGAVDVGVPDRLAKAAEAYIAFGQEQPALFRLMFGREFVDLSEHPGARSAAAAALAELSAIVAALEPAVEVQAVTLVAWSLVHGYTSLCIEAGLEGPEARVERARLFSRTVVMLARAD